MSVSVTYDRNGATGGAVPVDATAYTIGASVTVIGNTGSLNYAGYNFDGWNTAANGTGTAYDPGDTFLIAADTTIYAIWASATSLVTPTTVREHIATALSDLSIQQIIDAEEQEIIARFGGHAAQTEQFEAEIPGTLLFPKRAMLSVTSVVETILWPDTFIGGYGESTATLDATDYAIEPGGKSLRRLSDGTHPRDDWGQRVVVTYAPVSENAKRVMALINLCKLAINTSAGIKSESVGDGEYSYTLADVASEREKIYATLGSNQRNFA